MAKWSEIQAYDKRADELTALGDKLRAQAKLVRQLIADGQDASEEQATLDTYNAEHKALTEELEAEAERLQKSYRK